MVNSLIRIAFFFPGVLSPAENKAEVTCSFSALGVDIYKYIWKVMLCHPFSVEFVVFVIFNPLGINI